MNKVLSGWQDILVKIPPNWEMFFEKKSPKNKKKETGFFGYRDLSSKKLELSWVRFDYNSKPELEKVIKDYKKNLKKKHKHINIRTEGEKFVNSHNSMYIYWEIKNEDIQGYMMVWNCEITFRLLICQSQFTIKESSREKPRIMEIMAEINCHSEREHIIWTAPNLQISSPFGMKLIKREFLIGLSFIQLRNNNFNLLAYRIGLANQKIQKSEELPDWYQNYYKQHLPSIPISYKPLNFEKLQFEKLVDVWKYIQKPNKRFLFGKYYETYLWTNPEKNNIYSIIYQTKKLPTKELDVQINRMIKSIINNN